jgi:hypothetical protein
MLLATSREIAELAVGALHTRACCSRWSVPACWACPWQIRAVECRGALGPVIYGALIGDGSNPFMLFLGYLLGAGVMIAGGLVAWFLAVDAEGKSLEEVATPLAAAGVDRRRGSVRAEGEAGPNCPERAVAPVCQPTADADGGAELPCGARAVINRTISSRSAADGKPMPTV